MNAPSTMSIGGWSPARIAAAAVFAIALATALACAAVYCAGALFLLANKADPRQAQFTSIVRYWMLYADDAPLRRKLVASMVTSGAAWMFVLPGAIAISTRHRRSLHGDARFANQAEVQRAGLLTDGSASSGPAILIGRYRGRFLSLPGQLSVMLSAPTRSGKGVGVVIPNLLNWPDSVVVLDIKGENYQASAGYRAQRGQAVFAFAPFDEQGHSHRWNPLSAVRTSPAHRVGDLLAIGQVFFPNDGSGTSAEAFFNDQTRNLFLGIGLYLIETPALPRTIGEMLRQSSGQGQPMKDHFTRAIADRQEGPQALSIECVDALQRLLSNSENTLTSIVSTFNAPLVIFADAVVDAATSADDFELGQVRRARMSLYVCIPPNRLASARPLLNLFFSQLVSLNTVQLPGQDESLRYQCLLVHDEFTSMGRVGVISTAAAFLAGYNLRLLTVVQAMSQLDATYGDKEARTFATNHGAQILFAPREQRDADEYSAMLGHFTERATSRGRSRSFGAHGHHSVSANVSDQRRALLLPQEFKEIGAERMVVLVENCKPILAEKIRYHREKVFKERLRPPPPVPPLDIELHLAKVHQRVIVLPDEVLSTLKIDVNRLVTGVSHVPDLPPDADPSTVGRCIDGFFSLFAVIGDGGSIVASSEDVQAFRGPDASPTESGTILDLADLEQSA